MRIPSHHDQQARSDVAMTPMIDVVFQLMIFFICTASFQAAEELLPSNLAIASGTSTPAPIEMDPELERILVKATHADGTTQWVVNERTCDSLPQVRQLLHMVAEIDRTLPVVLDVAGEVPLGDLIDVYDVCRLEKFEKIQFAAKSRAE
jgi:biopolymer transport protein ExbD